MTVKIPQAVLFFVIKGSKAQKRPSYIILDRQIKAKFATFPNKRYAKIINEKGETLYEVAVE